MKKIYTQQHNTKSKMHIKLFKNKKEKETKSEEKKIVRFFEGIFPNPTKAKTNVFIWGLFFHNNKEKTSPYFPNTQPPHLDWLFST